MSKYETIDGRPVQVDGAGQYVSIGDTLVAHLDVLLDVGLVREVKHRGIYDTPGSYGESGKRYETIDGRPVSTRCEMKNGPTDWFATVDDVFVGFVRPLLHVGLIREVKPTAADLAEKDISMFYKGNVTNSLCRFVADHHPDVAQAYMDWDGGES